MTAATTATLATEAATAILTAAVSAQGTETTCYTSVCTLLLPKCKKLFDLTIESQKLWIFFISYTVNPIVYQGKSGFHLLETD